MTQSGGDTFVPITDGAATLTLDLLNQPGGVSASHYKLVSDNHGATPGTLLAVA